MKASVIIPAYNAAAFLEKAVRSISDFEPRFPFEILIVDDGSTDETLSLATRLSETIPQVRVITGENAGPAEARNRGIREAKGEYLLFCDSDDTFSPGALEKAVSLCEKEGADVLIFGYTVVQDGKRTDYCYPETVLQTPSHWQKHLAPLYSANMLNQVWGKVFRADLLKQEKILFPREMWGEDRLFFFSVLEKAKKVAVTSHCLYDYIQQKSSLITRFIPEKGEVCQRIHRRILALAAEKGALGPESDEVYSYMYVKSLLSAFATLYSPSCTLSYREKRRFVKEILKQPEIKTANRFPSSAGTAFDVLARIIKSGNVTLNLLAARGMKIASKLLPHLFRKAKHAFNKGE